MEYLFENFTDLEKNDPEFHEIFKNFAYGEVFEYSTLTKNDSLLATLATLIACQSDRTFKNIVSSALGEDISPEQVKEVLYQSVAYVGFGRASGCFDAAAEAFDENGIDNALDARSNTDSQNRYAKGRAIQDKYFGAEMIQMLNDNTPDDQQHFNTFLEGYCFGDFYTRDGLNDQQRELITFVFIATLGGCENQLRAHTQANLNVGNDKQKVISAVTVILPYIGFPRALNALAIVNEVCQ